MADALSSLIAANQPFPATDIETIPPESFNLPPDCTLASYQRLETALQRIAGADAAGLAGLLAHDPATHRFTVLRSTEQGSVRAVIAAVRNDLGARDQVAPALDGHLEPRLIASAAGLGSDRAVIFSLATTLKFTATPRVLFGFHWLREASAGLIEGQLGERIDSGLDVSLRAHLSDNYLAAVALDEEGMLRLRVLRRGESACDFNSSLSVAAEAVTPLAAANATAPLVQAILAAGSAVAQAAGAAASGVLATVSRLAQSAYQKALPALELKCAALLSFAWRSAARGETLLDCSFAFTESGMLAYGQALAGDFSGVLSAPSAGARVHKAMLTEALQGERTIELHMPFMDRKAWAVRWEALARAEIEAGAGGRLLVYTVKAADRIEQNNTYQSTLALAGSLLYPRATASFELSYTDARSGDAGHLARTLAPLLEAYGFPPEAARWLEGAAAAGGRLSSSLTLEVPGAAVAAWLRAPSERDPEFFDVYSKVSVAVQQATRRWLPYVYFSEMERYEELSAAYPLVFFASTRPFGGRPRSEFAYDLVGPDSPGVARPWAARPLATALERVHAQLLAAGQPQLARSYASWRAPEILAGIVKKPRLLNALLTGDAFFVDRLVRLGVEARAMAGLLAADPRKATRKLLAFAADFTALFHRRLRRLYGGRDFAAFGALLLVEATRALGATLEGDMPVSATLHVSLAGREQTFVNTGYRPH
jgi:hypothetical protein